MDFGGGNVGGEPEAKTGLDYGECESSVLVAEKTLAGTNVSD